MIQKTKLKDLEEEKSNTGWNDYSLMMLLAEGHTVGPKQVIPQGLEWAAVMVAPGDTADKSIRKLQKQKVSCLDTVFNGPQSDILSDYQLNEDSPLTNVALLLS